MGNEISRPALPAGSAGIDVAELSDLTFEKTLGTGRFMKSIRARHSDGVVFVKVVVKPYPQMSLAEYSRAIKKERKEIANVPNALGFKRDLETTTNGYLVRQYQYSSLYDRLSTRPFLETIEKKWIAFQLLSAVRDCHARDIYHGDIKMENILVTSWNWLYLVDFSSSFKPTFLPENNPADFNYYFDSNRLMCYIAPERFLPVDQMPTTKSGINWPMDIFSVGCVIAELFVERPIFSLSQLFKYKKSEYDPSHAHLSRIQDEDIRDMVSHMIQVEPESRYSADDYLKFWRKKAFPEYFYSFLHHYMEAVTDPSSGRAPVTSHNTNLGETDDRIEKVFVDFDKIAYFLGYENDNEKALDLAKAAPHKSETFPLCLDIPNNRHLALNSKGPPLSDDGTLIFATLVASSIRNTARASSRIKACDILLAFSEKLTDEAKLDRILPYIFSLLKDPSELVQIAAVRTLTQILALVKVVSPVNAFIFPEYLLPMLDSFVANRFSNPSALVRANYALCVASLANTAMRFLDSAQVLRADGSLPTVDPEVDVDFAPKLASQANYDSARDLLVEHFELQTKALLTDTNASVRRAFLRSISSLCVFFGTTKANDVILTHLNTYLNDKDWLLKCTFFETVVGVATYVGSVGLEDYILPLMVQALTDPEDFVIERVIRSFTSMVKLGLFQRTKTWELVDIVARFTMHPNIWIREAAAAYISSATILLTPSDVICIVSPIIKPFLKIDISNFSELQVLDALKPPLSRPVLDMASRWSLDSGTSTFWKSARRQRTFTFGPLSESIPTISTRDLNSAAWRSVPKNEKDHQWLNRLHNIGLSTDDELKLLALREYIWRMAQSSKSRNEDLEPSKMQDVDRNGIIRLQTLNIVPQNVILNDSVGDPEAMSPRSDVQDHEAPRSITDALLDASKTIDDPLARRKRSHANSRRLKETGQSSSMPRAMTSDTINGLSHSPSPMPSPRAGPLDSPDGSLPTSDTERPQVAQASRLQASMLKGPIRDNLGVDGKRLSRKGSAVNLMGRKDMSKTLAETATSSENASGTLEANSGKGGHSLSANGAHAISSGRARLGPGHNYEGHDPTILKLLNHVSLDTYPNDAAEFGTASNTFNRQQSIKKSAGKGTAKWRPEGILVAMLGEHTSSVNRVAVAPDHTFFITASDDGSVKVWDTARLESNAAQRSRQTYRHANGANVKSICFVEGSHSFVSAATDGSVHVVRVDVQTTAGATKFSKCRLVREYQLKESEYAVWMEHFKQENNSTLMIATNKSRVIALDLRTMAQLFVLKNPVHHGTITCFCIDKAYHWLLLATSHGILDFFDLRFRLRVKSWGLPGACPIYRLTPHPSRGRGHFVCVAGGTSQSEVTVWDIEKTICREVYRTVSPPNMPTPKDIAQNYEPWKPDQDPPETMLALFASNLNPIVSSSAIGSSDRGIRALFVGSDADDASSTTIPSNRLRGSGAFFLTAGSDRKLRYWDLHQPEHSEIYSGLEADEPSPTYPVSHPDTLTVVAERNPPAGPTAENAGRGERAGTKRRDKANPTQGSRGSVVSFQGQVLLKRHLDTITDVALLERPYGMTISVDRSGVIYVFR
ncbi:MAG: Serine/threonine-protein kinase [Vezdaea aestivalis]|nr:MAG: Serine/threonine-protein kinase [Vezdaea aestivalis]